MLFLSRMLSKAFFLAFVAFVQGLQKPEVEYCQSGSEYWINNININVQPWPVDFSGGKQITIKGGFI